MRAERLLRQRDRRPAPASVREECRRTPNARRPSSSAWCANDCGSKPQRHVTVFPWPAASSLTRCRRSPPAPSWRDWPRPAKAAAARGPAHPACGDNLRRRARARRSRPARPVPDRAARRSRSRGGRRRRRRLDGRDGELARPRRTCRHRGRAAGGLGGQALGAAAGARRGAWRRRRHPRRRHAPAAGPRRRARRRARGGRLRHVGARFVCGTPGERFLHPALLATLVYRFGPPDADAPGAPARLLANGQCTAVRGGTCSPPAATRTRPAT